MKIQIELGVLETDTYYNVAVGGKRFYRPVRSYTDPEFIRKISGMNNHKYRGDFIVTFKDGLTNLIKGKSIREFAKENGYNQSHLSKVANNNKTHKDIIKLEFLNDKKDN
jgi:hypothetical protein